MFRSFFPYFLFSSLISLPSFSFSSFSATYSIVQYFSTFPKYDITSTRPPHSPPFPDLPLSSPSSHFPSPHSTPFSGFISTPPPLFLLLSAFSFPPFSYQFSSTHLPPSPPFLVIFPSPISLFLILSSISSFPCFPSLPLNPFF